MIRLVHVDVALSRDEAGVPRWTVELVGADVETGCRHCLALLETYDRREAVDASEPFRKSGVPVNLLPATP